MKTYTAAVIGCGNIGAEEKNFGKQIQLMNFFRS